MEEKPLYESERLRIDYLKTSIDDHLLYIIEKDGEEKSFVIPRGVLRDFALTEKEKLEPRLNVFNSMLLYKLYEERISVDEVHDAFNSAYKEEERRFDEWKREQKKINSI